MLNNGRKTKRCPRCKNTCFISDVKCDDCGLLFARVDKATNFEAKQKIKLGEKDQVICVKKCPPDIKKWKLVTITVFGGLLGFHYFMVGKWIKGLLMLACFLFSLVIGVVLNGFFVGMWGGMFFSYFGPIIGVYTIIWLNDIRRVCFNTFGIPVSILTDEERETLISKKLKKQKRKEFLASKDD